MVINVIHSPHRVDRMQLLNKEIVQQHLEVMLWPAIMDKLASFRGISKAHKQIIAWARKERLPMVCIGEDDLKFTAPGAWAYFLENVPRDFDLYLASIYNEPENIKEDRTVEDFCGMTLYICNSRFYETFLSLPEMTNVDRALMRLGKYVVAPKFCCIQHNGFSDNKRGFANYDHIIGQHKLFGV